MYNLQDEVPRNMLLEREAPSRADICCVSILPEDQIYTDLQKRRNFFAMSAAEKKQWRLLC